MRAAGRPAATLLRLEGLALFIGMTSLYYIWDGSWWVYGLLFFVPDLSFGAYLSGPRFGAMIYNAAHSYLAPMAMMTPPATAADTATHFHDCMLSPNIIGALPERNPPSAIE